MPPGVPVTSDSDIESVLSLQFEKPKVRGNSVRLKYYCSIDGCNQCFDRLDHLDRHEYKHTGNKKHACHYDNCSKTYTIISHLKRHIRTTHEKQDKHLVKNVACEVLTCGKFFTSTSNMHRHIREVHENPKVYKCQFCDENFTQKLKMRRHEISQHTKVHPYNCGTCPKGFYQKWQWEKHEKTCKVYPCLICEKTFEKWTLFVKHCRETLHSRKCYECESCERVYAKPAELQAHVVAKHLENKNITRFFKCDYEGCQRSYVYERNLRQHIKTTHVGKKFKCHKYECDKEFSSVQNMQKHLKRSHSGNSSIYEEPSTSKSLFERKKRKDAGEPKVCYLVQLSGIAVNKEMNKRLNCREKEAMEEVAKHLSQEIDKYINSDEEASKPENKI